MKAQSNIVSIRTVSLATCLIIFMCLILYSSCCCIFLHVSIFSLVCWLVVIRLWNMWHHLHWLYEIFPTGLNNSKCHFKSCFVWIKIFCLPAFSNLPILAIHIHCLSHITFLIWTITCSIDTILFRNKMITGRPFFKQYTAPFWPVSEFSLIY